MDYLEATTQRTTSILLNGLELEVRRANLGLHYRLSIVLDRWQEARRNQEYKETVNLTFSYIALATDLDIETVKQASLSEVVISSLTLMNLNQSSGDLPFMRMSKKKDEYQCDYSHRALANWVSMLAKHYGWTPKYILNILTPEEAVCYMQEALIQEHEDRDFQYRLSEVAYKIVGKGANAKAKLVPLPKPYWMGRKPKELPKVKVPPGWLPQGNIIDGDTWRATS